MSGDDRSQSLCLLTLDALRCTPMARSDAFDWTPIYDALTLVLRGDVTDDEERGLFSRLLDARWRTTPSFDPAIAAFVAGSTERKA